MSRSSDGARGGEVELADDGDEDARLLSKSSRSAQRQSSSPNIMRSRSGSDQERHRERMSLASASSLNSVHLQSARGSLGSVDGGGGGGVSQPDKQPLQRVEMRRPISVNEALDRVGNGRFQTRLMFMCGLCWAADAMEALILSFLVSALRTEWQLQQGVDGLIGAVVFVGIFIGNWLFGILSDRHGRRFGYFSTALFTAVFGLLTALATNIVWLLILRFLVGIGIGGAHVAYSLYSEFLPTESRGSSLLLNQLFWSVGALAEVLIAWLVMPTLGWRYLLVLSSLPLVIVLTFFHTLPESPRFLILAGRLGEAKAVLNRVSACNGSTLHLHDWELKVSKGHCYAHNSVPSAVSKLLQGNLSSTTKRLWIMWFTSALVYYGMVFITPRFFQHENEYVESFISTLSEFPGLLIPVYGIDRLGRRRTLSLQYLMTGLVSFMIVFSMGDTVDTILLFAGRMFISGAFASIYIYTTEVYPTNLRSTGLGVCSSLSRVAGFVTSFVANDAEPSSAMFTFTLFCVGASVAAISSPIETAHRDMTDDNDENETSLEMPRVDPSASKSQTRDRSYRQVRRTVDSPSPRVDGSLQGGRTPFMAQSLRGETDGQTRSLSDIEGALGMSALSDSD